MNADIASCPRRLPTDQVDLVVEVFRMLADPPTTRTIVNSLVLGGVVTQRPSQSVRSSFDDGRHWPNVANLTC
jgi:hypothetical protein